MEGCSERKLTVALAGNPNVGKSTLFNVLTGLRQHTGNWPGKTVGTAVGTGNRRGNGHIYVDLPGTYSLTGASEEERVAAEYIASGNPDCTVVVCDGSALERSLILALQILERTDKAVVCVNLMDEAQRRGIYINKQRLSELLGVPVVLTAAGKKEGLRQLLSSIYAVSIGQQESQTHKWGDYVADAEMIAAECVVRVGGDQDKYRRQVDRLLVSRRFGVPLMLLMLFGIIWLTVWGANLPSDLLWSLLNTGGKILEGWMVSFPWWLRGILLDGLYMTTARVMAVMLPPMAIFFPLFTLLEDIGYLPRMAFLLDPCMAKCGGCGKQALTLCMGLGCNAVGVMGCRIIDSPRQRLAAMLTNAMVPCNGRFPTLIVLGSLFFPGAGSGFVVAACILLGASGAVAVSGVLNAGSGDDGTFLMEMPPFRRPRIGKILIRSLLDRTLLVAGRAVRAAAPAGVILWLVSHTELLAWFVNLLEPVGVLLGMNGVILLGFILSFPANELLLPVILMLLGCSENLQGAVDPTLLLQSGITRQMGVCMMVFTLFHWPCATTLMTIYRETGSKIKTAAAFALPAAVGCTLCLMLNLVLNSFGA